ncbi:nucleotide triphosphate diphosphatase NUDT15 [Legionella fallonii]|uniref:Nudix hydrolase 1 n=1 Tax=Legionella fallonii LLAP-10 TaxID=1212491 RepID=A0A098G3E9_9GAMM|nr:NUDIX hydrolase [Legionella fallonii]CEG56993.1 Nudix hydrolase 1 [Legionella fallonii LLAP-10]
MNHPKVGIGVLIFQDTKILLGQRIKSHGLSTWGPPGGHLEYGETFEECAIRETKEETGLVISNPTVIAVTNDVFKEEQKHYVSIFLRAKYPQGQMVENLEQDKVASWEWIDIDLLPENLFLPLKNLLQAKGRAFFTMSFDSEMNSITAS